MATGIQLTRDHQRAQIRNGLLVTLMIAELGRKWRAGQVDDRGFIGGSVGAELVGYQAALRLTRGYMVAHRQAVAPELVDVDLVEAVFDLAGAHGRATATLDAMQRISVLDWSPARVDQEFWRIIGNQGVWANKATQMASRDTIVSSCEAAGSSWRRVTDGDPCAFCAMLAGRGPVYRSRESAAGVVGHTHRNKSGLVYSGRKRGTRSIGERYHDRCGCTVEEITGAWTPTAEEQRFVDLYADARAKCEADGVPANVENVTRAMRELGDGIVHDAVKPQAGDGGSGVAGTGFAAGGGDPIRDRAQRIREAAIAAEVAVTGRVTQAVSGTPGLIVDADTRIKSLESVMDKLARLSRRVSLDVAEGKINDALRYRVVAASSEYAATVSLVSRGLRDGGVRLISSSDMWADSRYKGLNVTYELAGQLFEVQFHSHQSYRVAVSPEVRALYEEARHAAGPERREIDGKLKELWHVAVPPGAWEL